MSPEEQAVLVALARTILEAGLKADSYGQPVEVRVIIEPGSVMRAALRTRFGETEAEARRIW